MLSYHIMEIYHYAAIRDVMLIRFTKSEYHRGYNGRKEHILPKILFSCLKWKFYSLLVVKCIKDKEEVKKKTFSFTVTKLKSELFH